MSAIMLGSSRSRITSLVQFIKQRNFLSCVSSSVARFSTENTNESSSAENDKKIGGFAQAFEKYTNIKEPEAPSQEVKTFASLLRSSKFIDVCILYCHYFIYFHSKITLVD